MKIIEYYLQSKCSSAETIRGKEWTDLKIRSGNAVATSLKQAKEKLKEWKIYNPSTEFRFIKVTIIRELIKND